MTDSIGLDIGGTKIAGAVFGDDGAQIAEQVVPTPQDYETFLDACASVVAYLRGQSGKSGVSVGIGLPGFIDHEKGSISCANLPFMTGRPFRKDLGQKIGSSVFLANDANCMALAEATNGAGQGAEMALGLIMGTGIGGGLIHRGQIIDGPNGLTGEIGHLPFPFREESDGPLAPCACGQKGCIEKTIAGPALARLYAFMTGEGEREAFQIAENARAGEEKALRVLDRYYECVAKAMIVFIHAFDPHVIVVSGGLNSLPGLYEEVPKRWGKYCFVKNPKTRFVKAIHGPMAGLRGAAQLGRSP